MAKSLTDVLKDASKHLEGVRKSDITSKNILGKDPGVDYAPKSKAEQDWADMHSIEDHEDRVGNKKGAKHEPYQSDAHYVLNSTKEKRHGHTAGADKKVYDGGVSEDAQCNMSSEGVPCAVHGSQECSMVLREKGNPLRNMVRSMKTKAKRSDPSRKDYLGFRQDLNRAARGQPTRQQQAFTDALAGKKNLDEKHLTPAESKKREEVAQAIARENPKMPMGKKMAIATSTAKKIAEDLAVPLMQGEDDNQEVISMVKSELRALTNKAMHLLMSMPEGMHVEPWVQSKISQAKEMVSSVHDFVVYGDHEADEEGAPGEGGYIAPGMSSTSSEDAASASQYGAPSSQFGDGRI